MFRSLIYAGMMVCLSWIASSQSSLAATPTVEDALQLKPFQKGIEYDIPTAEEVKNCT